MSASQPVPTLEAIDTTVRPPGSKSETIRALTAAALADGRSHLYKPLRADDPTAMSAALRAMGIAIQAESEPWVVDGRGGRLDVPEGPLDANESGLSARILLALAACADGTSRLVGGGRLPERPMTGVVDALVSQGVEVSGDHIPIDVTGRGPLWGGEIEVDCSGSSQFATALMLVAPIMREPTFLEVRGLSGSAGYLSMTESIMRRFGASVTKTVTGYEIASGGYLPSDVVIEPDASAAVYPMAIAAVTGSRVVIDGLGDGSRQPDMRVASILGTMGCEVTWEETNVTIDARSSELMGVEVDMSDAPDGALALAVVCLFAAGPSRISGLGSLRHKESDRLAAISEEIRRIGGIADVDGDTLVVEGGDLHAGEVDSHGDHRIAMAMATAGTRIPGIRIVNPSVVNKTWPEFWGFFEILSGA